MADGDSLTVSKVTVAPTVKPGTSTTTKTTRPKTVPVGKAKKTTNNDNENDKAYNKMVADLKAEKNWFKKIAIYWNYCTDFHQRNPQALAYANNRF